MLSMDRILGSLSGKLDQPVPALDDNGDRLFLLADGMVLGVRETPGGGVTAWSEVTSGPPGPDAAERRAAAFLRQRLARLRREGAVAGTVDEDGRILLFIRAEPENEDDWLDIVRRLLNETETARQAMNNEKE